MLRSVLAHHVLLELSLKTPEDLEHACLYVLYNTIHIAESYDAILFLAIFWEF